MSSIVDAFYVDQVVEYRPPISGGVVIGVITKLPDRNTAAIRVTDGTGNYPTGSFTTTSLRWLS